MKYVGSPKLFLTQILPVSSNIGQFLGQESFVKKIWGGWGRAILGSSMMVIFALMILLVSMLAGANPAKVRPFEATSSAIEVGEVMMATEEAKIEIEYYLPYPGILPDSPLYKLKAGRDRIMLWFTFDEGRKAEKELLYADKRINAAMALIDGGKTELGVSTVTKSEKYLESSIRRTVGLQESGKDVKSMLLTLEKAAQKHLELLDSMKSKLSDQENNVLEKSVMSTDVQLQKVQQTLREES